LLYVVGVVVGIYKLKEGFFRKIAPG